MTFSTSFPTADSSSGHSTNAKSTHSPIETYVIEGGEAGKERLNAQSRIVHEPTMALLQRLGLKDGMRFLDAAFGGGDIAVAAASIVGPSGSVVGIDLDPALRPLVEADAKEAGLQNLSLQTINVFDFESAEPFDMIYCRFLLVHLPDPVAAVRQLKKSLKPGGVFVTEDVVVSGLYCYPECDAFDYFKSLLGKIVAHRGNDPNIGRRLADILEEAGFPHADLESYQKASMRPGDIKTFPAWMMAQIRHSVLDAGLISPEDYDRISQKLQAYLDDPKSMVTFYPVYQSWALNPS